MEGFRQLSTLTKITFVLVCFFMFLVALGHFPWTHSIGALGLFLLGGTAVTATLDDPESEERIPLALRLLVGFGTALPFALVAWLLQRAFPLGGYLLSSPKP